MEEELNDINNPELTALERASAADKLKAYGEKLFENFPLHMRKILRKKYESNVDSMLKTSNETAKVQAEMDRNTARFNVQKWADAHLPNDSDFDEVINGKYTSKIAGNKKIINSNEVKTEIMNMLHTNADFSKYGAIYQFMKDNKNSSFTNYLFDVMYPLYEANKHVVDEKGRTANYASYKKDEVINKLDSLIDVLPSMKILEQSNIRYSGN